ncbi:DUF3159 domain-containing protein [Kocuria varians]|uniref:Potassium ABC transporter n=2 Tax=Kocuria TaxID=57493 RepID=A0A7D7Q3C0_KOCVA|nr:DUF3159 domain-containing protein [Kocuria varians]QMS56981.1 hypothetical protein CIB50_0001706 [Kocuria varians]
MSSPANPGAEDAPRQASLGTDEPGAPARDAASRPAPGRDAIPDRDAAADRAAEDFARRSGLRRDEAGQLDVLSAVGGWRGVLESLLPGLVYLVCVVVTGQLGPALIASLAVAALFTLVRLVQRQPVTQALGGLVGVGICALFARVGGDALDYYVWGFVTNAVWLLGLAVSALAGWPLLGVLFGYIRGEGTHWRRDPGRRRAYQRVNAVLLAMFAARLLVQLPLYFAGDVAGLGITRLVMGAPLYAAVLWLGWLWSRPRPAPPAG